MTGASDEAARVTGSALFGGHPPCPQENRQHLQFGVLVPPAFAAGSGDPARNGTECLLRPGPGATLHVRLRFRHLRAWTVHDAMGRPIPELVVDGKQVFARDEEVPREVDAEFAVDELRGGITVRFDFPDEIDMWAVSGGSVRRRCRFIVGRLMLSTTPLSDPTGVLRLRLDVVNDSVCPPAVDRETALRTSLIGAHALLTLGAGEILSADETEPVRP